MDCKTYYYCQPLAICRKSWKESGQLFSEYGISIRCVRSDQMGAVSH